MCYRKGRRIDRGGAEKHRVRAELTGEPPAAPLLHDAPAACAHNSSGEGCRSDNTSTGGCNRRCGDTTQSWPPRGETSRVPCAPLALSSVRVEIVARLGFAWLPGHSIQTRYSSKRLRVSAVYPPRSMIVATPWPMPTQRVARPREASVRIISCTSVVTIRAPVQPSG